MIAILPEGATFQFQGLAGPLRVIRLLGGGGQGQVYEAEYAGESVALKWYFSACIRQDIGLDQRLRECIRATSPNASFLWPLALLSPPAESLPGSPIPPGTFGYMMRLRPADYVGASDHVGGHLQISVRNVLRACFFLAEAFHELHLKGLCYKDISLGNLFLQPHSGRILICDNDNVDVDGRDLGSAVGTPGFMAPEVLLGRMKPGSSSDLFSLSVLLFRLLTRHDPLKGALELQIRCLDEPARRRLYGEDPVFIFDAIDERNRPDPIEHAAALLTWPIYPSHLQQLFLQTLGPGMKNPGRRVYTGQWKTALARSLDWRRLCPHCGQEVFTALDQASLCWACAGPLDPAPHFLTARGPVAAAAENELHPHHFDPLLSERIDSPVAIVEAHPIQAAILGLKNLSHETWTADLQTGESLPVQPGQRCNLSLITRLRTCQGSIELFR
ncbi:MAG: protein kinase [Cyanobium sp.]